MKSRSGSIVMATIMVTDQNSNGFSIKKIIHWKICGPYSEDQINQRSSSQEGNKGRSQVRHKYAWHCFCFILAHALGMDQGLSWTGGNEAFKIKEVFGGGKKQRVSSFFSNLTDYDKHHSKHLSHTALSWWGEHDVIQWLVSSWWAVRHRELRLLRKTA